MLIRKSGLLDIVTLSSQKFKSSQLQNPALGFLPLLPLARPLSKGPDMLRMLADGTWPGFLLQRSANNAAGGGSGGGGGGGGGGAGCVGSWEQPQKYHVVACPACLSKGMS